MRTILIDTASSAIPFAATLIERLLLTAVLIRAWGLADFEFWSLAMAATAFLTLLEGGIGTNFGNRMTEALVNRREKLAVAIFRQSNLIFAGAAALCALAALFLAQSSGFQSFIGIRAQDAGQQSLIVLLALGWSVALQLLAGNAIWVYRAHRAFGRGIGLMSGFDIARLLLLSAAVYAGAGLALAALLHLALTIVKFVYVLGLDVPSRWPAFRIRWEVPRRDTLDGALRDSLMYSVPALPQMAVNQAPVLVLGGAAALGGGLVGQFILLRTLVNLARTAVFMLINAVALEVSRVGMASGRQRTVSLIRPVNVQTALLMGMICGALACYGAPIVAYWSGNAIRFDLPTTLAMLLPLVVAPAFLLSSHLLKYGGTPQVWTIGSIVQLPLALLCYAATPSMPIVLRLALALGVAELIAVGLPVTLATVGRDWREAVIETARLCAISLAAAAVTYGLSRALVALLPVESLFALALHGTAIAVLGALGLGSFGWRQWRQFRSRADSWPG